MRKVQIKIAQDFTNFYYSSTFIFIVNYRVNGHNFVKSYEDYVQAVVDRSYFYRYSCYVYGSYLLTVHYQADGEKRLYDGDFIYLGLVYNNDSYSFVYDSYHVSSYYPYHLLRGEVITNGDMVHINL